MSDWTLSLTGIGDDIPLLSVWMGDAHSGGMQVSKHPDAHSPALLHAETTGATIAQGVLQSGTITYRVDNCVLSSFSMHDDVESWTINYTKVEIEAAAADGGESSTGDSDLSQDTE